MVLGYLCSEHGYRDECDVSEGGERICPDCGVFVSGLTGRTRSTSRSPPTDVPNAAEGNIMWEARLGYSGQRTVTVEAFDLRDAIGKAVEKVDDPQDIKEIMPRKTEYRH